MIGKMFKSYYGALREFGWKANLGLAAAALFVGACASSRFAYERYSPKGDPEKSAMKIVEEHPLDYVMYSLCFAGLGLVPLHSRRLNRQERELCEDEETLSDYCDMVGYRPSGKYAKREKMARVLDVFLKDDR